MSFLWKYFFFAFFVACVTTTPETGRRKVALPDTQMNPLGVEAYKEILAREKISKNPQHLEIVERSGKRIATASGENFNWQYTVIDNPKTINAFCLPGGKIAVYTGIFPVAKTEAALAAVIGHEVAHATARHGGERMAQTLAVQGLSVGAAVALKNNKNANIILGALGVGAQFGVLLPFSRYHESEADKIGLIYMARAGYRPEAAVELWQRMAKAGGAQPPEFMSTHPSNQSRISDLNSQMGEVQGAYNSSEKQTDKDLPSI